MASEEMEAAAAQLREVGTFSGDTVDVPALRAQMASQVLPLPEDVTRSDLDADGIPACHIAAPGVRNDRGILYLHGGGYVLGSLDTHQELMGRFSQACRAPVLGVDYRLAPEHPFPAAVEDAVKSYDRLLGSGIDPARVVIAGDSAGGGLTLACLLTLKREGKRLPAGAVLLSPWTDLTASGDSIRTRAELDPMVSPDLIGPMSAHYVGDAQPDDPIVSPLFGDLAGLPPLLIQVGGHEILLDDSVRLADRARAAGVDVDLTVYEGAFHVFQTVPFLPESAEALTHIGAFFDRVTG